MEGSIRPRIVLAISPLNTKEDENVHPDLAMITVFLQTAPDTISAYVFALSISNIARGDPFVLESPKKTRGAAIFLLKIEWWPN